MLSITMNKTQGERKRDKGKSGRWICEHYGSDYGNIYDNNTQHNYIVYYHVYINEKKKKM